MRRAIVTSLVPPNEKAGGESSSSRLDPTLLGYSAALIASFAISHVDAIHNNLSRYFPRTYPTLNVLLPCGRAIALLGIFARAAEIAEGPPAAADTS